VRPSDCAATVRLVSRIVATNPHSRIEDIFIGEDAVRRACRPHEPYFLAA
jgi:hypothetical protein